MVTSLKDNEVFVFGSNSTGFHGAGAAGLACRGDSRNTWRTDTWFLKAMKAPVSSPDRIGKWAVYGVARGFQIGKEGKSYAIQTIVKPGLKRSTPLEEIKEQLLAMFEYAKSTPELDFLMTPVGAGLAGYTNKEMKALWDEIKDKAPSNIIAPKDLYEEVDLWTT